MTTVAHRILYSNEYSGVVEITKSAMFQELNKDSPIYSKYTGNAPVGIIFI